MDDEKTQDNVLPAWARWIAQDADGLWWCYEAEPHRHEHGWYENEVGRCQRIERPSIDDWMGSLERIPESGIYQ